jgi:predicted membrane channel-forming protein YqfA (hemolysin III family)
MITIIIIASAVMGGMGRRFAGGLLGQWIGPVVTTQVARLSWGLLCALCALLAGAPSLHALAIIPCIWLGSIFGYFGSMTAGHQPGKTALIDGLLLLAHGIAGVLPLAIGAKLLGYPVSGLLFAGVLCPAAYFLAWAFPLQVPVLGCYCNDPKFQTDPPPTAELIWGAAIGVAIAATVFLKHLFFI